MTKIVFFLEGLIGAGKSTIGKLLVDKINADSNNVGDKKIKATWIPEPVDLWLEKNILQDFCADMKNNAYKFQSYAFITRMNDILKVTDQLQHDGVKHIIIIERSIFSDRFFFAKNLYDSKLLTEVEYDMYCSWWNLWNRIFPFSNFSFIYIKPSFEETINRIKARNRNGEVVPVEYQKQLQSLHDNFFCNILRTEELTHMHVKFGEINNAYVKAPFISIETDADYRNNDNIINEILSFITIDNS